MSLMMDQKGKFVPRGVAVEFVGEAQQDESAEKKVIQGEAQLVLISPEYLICNPIYRNMLVSSRYKEHLVGLVVDEAHCVKTW